jgi:N-acetylglucosaminyldiphosphoundecaprenol N-acetyl-beta-D-mannosaminyltransferase
VMAQLGEGIGGWIVTANLDHLRRLARHQEYRDLIAPAELVVADGKPLIWAARLQGTPLPGVVAGSNLVWSLTAAAVSGNRSIYFLGGVPGAAEAAVAVLARKYPGLQVAGVSSPVVRDPSDPTCVDPIRTVLIAAAPDIVYVALGSPKQEQLIAALKASLPGAWWIGVGISFSYIAGDIPRAPRWMRHCGMEWFYRLWQEPGRLARRYLFEGLPFAAVLFGRSVLGRFRHDWRTGQGKSSR